MVDHSQWERHQQRERLLHRKWVPVTTLWVFLVVIIETGDLAGPHTKV